MLITQDWLKRHNVCQEGVIWYQSNFKQPVDTEKVEIIGDYENYFQWVKAALKCKLEYDNRNNIIKKIYPSGSIWRYEYDDRNNRIKVISPNGNITQFEYDERNNRIKEIYSDGSIIHFEYDYKHNAQGNLTELYENNIKILQIKYKD